MLMPRKEEETDIDDTSRKERKDEKDCFFDTYFPTTSQKKIQMYVIYKLAMRDKGEGSKLSGPSDDFKSTHDEDES